MRAVCLSHISEIDIQIIYLKGYIDKNIRNIPTFSLFLTRSIENME